MSTQFWRHFISNGHMPPMKSDLQQSLWEVCETFLTVDPRPPAERRRDLVHELKAVLDAYSSEES